MSNPKICLKCQKEYGIEHLYCSFCGSPLVDNPIYLKEQEELKHQRLKEQEELERQKELYERTYSASDYYSAKKELVEKVNLLISKYRRFEDEYGIKRIIREIEDNCEYIKKLLDNKENLYKIKQECEHRLKCYYDSFESKFYNFYLWDHFFCFDAIILREKHDKVKYKLKYYLGVLRDIAKYATCYPLRPLAVENVPLLEKDIGTVDKLFVDLCARVETQPKERFIEFVIEPDLVNELFRVIEIVNNALYKYGELLSRIRTTSR